MRTEITFGIITDGNQPARVQRLIDSIKALNAPAEIILVGGLPVDGVIHIRFDEAACKDCICHKKNLVTLHAQSDVIVYCHDYLEFESDWWQNFKAFGLEWDIQLNPITRPDGVRYRDWVGTDTQPQPYGKPFDNSMYINGAYWVAKKWVGEKHPQNESLRWKENDEIDFSERIKAAGLRVVMNPNSKVKTQYNKGAFEPTGEPVDIVYKTYSKDKEFLWDSIRSVKKNVIGYGNIYLLTDDALGAIPKDLSDLQIEIIQTPKLKFDAKKADGTYGYSNQIFVKLSLFQYLPIERCLLLDSDMIVNNVWDISKEPNRWFKRDWSESGGGVVWKPCVERLIGNGSFNCMGYPAWFLTRHLMNSLLVYLESKLNTKYTDPQFWNNLINFAGNKISEFELMGNYLFLINSLDYELRNINGSPYPITQFWSWGGYEKAKPEINKILMAKEKTTKSLPKTTQPTAEATPAIERIPAPLKYRFVEAYVEGGEHWKPTEIVRTIKEARNIIPEAEYVIVTSPTASLLPEQMDALVLLMDENPNCAFLQPSSGNAHEFLKNTPNRPKYRLVPFVEFWCFIVRVSVWDKLKPAIELNEGWGFDIDSCLQAHELGFEVAVTETFAISYDKSKQTYPAGHAARAEAQMHRHLQAKWKPEQIAAIEAKTGAEFYYFTGQKKK